MASHKAEAEPKATVTLLNVPTLETLGTPGTLKTGRSVSPLL